MKCEEFSERKFIKMMLIIEHKPGFDLAKFVEKYSENECAGRKPAVLEYWLHYPTCEDCPSSVRNVLASVDGYRFYCGIRKVDSYYERALFG